MSTLQEVQLCIVLRQIIQTPDLPDKVALPTVAWVPDLHCFREGRQTECHFRRIVADRDKSARPQHSNQFSKERLAHRAFVGAMRPIAKGIVGFVRMKRKHVPEEYGSGNQCEHAPDDRRGALRHH